MLFLTILCFPGIWHVKRYSSHTSSQQRLTQHNPQTAAKISTDVYLKPPNERTRFLDPHNSYQQPNQSRPTEEALIRSKEATISYTVEPVEVHCLGRSLSSLAWDHYRGAR